MVLPERRRGPSGPISPQSQVSEFSPELYDAVVAESGADFTLPSAAFAAGALSIWVRRGTYRETADVVLTDGMSMTGESGAIIDLRDGFQVRAGLLTGTQTSTGTVATTNGSATVTGTGTAFTSLLVGGLLPQNTFIAIGVLFHRVAAVADDTTLTLAEVWRGNPLTGQSFIAQQMASGIQVTNVSLVEAVDTALLFSRVRAFRAARVTIDDSGSPGNAALLCDDAGEGEFAAVSVMQSGGNASNCLDCRSLQYSLCNFSCSVQDGFELNNCVAVTANNCLIAENDGAGVDIQGTGRFKFTDCTVADNDLAGFSVVSTVDVAIIAGCTVLRNQNGMSLAAQRTVVSACAVRENLAVGVIWGAGGGATASAAITGCTISANITIGIDCDGANCTMTGNVCASNSVDGIDVAGDDNIITGNRCRGNTTNGVRVRTSADRTIVTSNNLRDNGTSLADSGVGTISANNAV